MAAKYLPAVIAILLLSACVACDSPEQKAKLQRQEEAARVASSIADLSSRHNAITDWQEPLKNMDFSIDVEPAFVRGDHRPFLFYATLEDVKRQNNATVLYFRTTATEKEPTMQLILDCNGCDLQKLRDGSRSVGDFGVVAEPTSVYKAINGSHDGPDFILNGKFIEAQFVGDYALDKALSRRPD